jgi:hypothetical protein
MRVMAGGTYDVIDPGTGNRRFRKCHVELEDSDFAALCAEHGIKQSDKVTVGDKFTLLALQGQQLLHAQLAAAEAENVEQAKLEIKSAREEMVKLIERIKQ